MREYDIARIAIARLLLPALLVGVLMSGCSKKLRIVQMPSFYTPDLKTIAIAPFRNQTRWKGAGEIISDRVAAQLMANGTYRVFNRNDLKTLMDESDLQIALGTDSTAATEKLKQLTQVQAILIGTVGTYAATTNSQPRRDPIYSTNRNGTTFISGYRSYVWTRNEANVSVTASLIRVSDGTTIYATPQPAWSRVWAEGSPAKKDPNACLAEAANSVGNQLVATFAPIQREIKINPAKALRTATELYDNKWTYRNSFRSTDEKMYVVLALPASCDRNRFRLVIVRKNQREELASQDVTWDKKHAGFGYLFSPKALFQKGGPGDYEVKFYSGAEPVMRSTFRIH